MKTNLALIVLAAGLLTSSAWAAQPITLRVRTAGDLAELCGADPKSPGADAKINYCHGFAQGVVDLELLSADADTTRLVGQFATVFASVSLMFTLPVIFRVKGKS